MFLTCHTVQMGGLLGFSIMTSRAVNACQQKSMYIHTYMDGGVSESNYCFKQSGVFW